MLCILVHWSGWSSQDFAATSFNAASQRSQTPWDLRLGDVCGDASDCKTTRCSRKRRRLPDLGSCRSVMVRSFFRLPKNDSATALSQQLPLRLSSTGSRGHRHSRASRFQHAEYGRYTVSPRIHCNECTPGLAKCKRLGKSPTVAT